MSPKMSFGLLLRLAILLAAFLVQSGEGASYRDFANRHLDFPKTGATNANAYCNLIMRRRGLTRRVCKPTNTFINANPNDVQDICRGGGNHAHRNLYDSRSSFPVVTCRNRGRFPRCNYVGRQQTKRVRVACVNRLPVHFDRLL